MKDKNKTNYTILTAISSSHMLNDMMQSLIVAIYPILKSDFSLDLAQIGLITLAYQLTASFLQPLIGMYTDKHPQPYSLPIGMSFTFFGLILMSYAGSFPLILIAAALVGVGSAVFHPESSRVARMASGGRFGFSQAFFQVGGNFGSSLGPLLAAMIITPYGKGNLVYFSLFALLTIVILFQVSKWYSKKQMEFKLIKVEKVKRSLPKKTIVIALIVLLTLVFSKAFYLTSLTSYYQFYLIDKFSVTERSAQIYLFIFLFSVVVGTFIGGPIGDRIGRKHVIWVSILGTAPFALALPYAASLSITMALTIIIGLVLSSAFSAILVYAQELLPGRVGMISGLFFGFSFGMGGLGAAVLGKVAVMTSLEYVYIICSFLPLLGILTVFLPKKIHTQPV